MTAIIHRSWLVNMGGSPPPELAYIVSDHRGRRVVTWADVIEERRQHQRQRLDRLRGGCEPRERAYKLWVAYFDQDIFGGWHAFLDTYGGDALHGHAWIDRDRRWLRPRILEAFPLLLPLWDGRKEWEHWKVAFARRYARRRQDGQPVGVAYVWWDGQDTLRPVYPGGVRPSTNSHAQSQHTRGGY